MRPVVSVLAIGLAGSAHAEDRVQAAIGWGMTTLELGTATTLTTAIVAERFGERAALGGGLATFGGAIAAGVLAYRFDAPLAGAYAMHGGLFVGMEFALLGALVDHDHRGPRFRKLALGMGLVGAAGGALVGATRIPTESYAMPWMVAPLAGGVSGALAMTVAQLASPSDHASRNIALGSALGMGAGLVLGWILAEQRIGDIDPEPVRAPRMFVLSGRL